MVEAIETPKAAKSVGRRSPNYPVFDLTTALEKIRVVYEKDRRSLTTLQVIAGHLGYKNTDGPGGRALSCLRQYGLLEESLGAMRVSDAAYKLLHLPEEDEDRPMLMKQAALKPTLYRLLNDEYPAQLPSDPTLKSFLLKRGFNPDSLDGLIANFRVTMEVANVYNVSGNGAEEEPTNTMLPRNPASPKLPTPPAFESAVSDKSYGFAFAGNGRAELRVMGEYSVEDLEDLKAYLEVTLRGLVRSKKTETVP
jgi:hypothetical protein